MTEEKIKLVMKKYVNDIPIDTSVIEKLSNADDECFDDLMKLRIVGKVKTLMFSIFLGGIAVDRFYVGKVGSGVAKMIFHLIAVFASRIPITEFPVLGIVGMMLSISSSIWGIVDIFTMYRVAKVHNLDMLNKFLDEHQKKKSGNVPVVSEVSEVSETSEAQVAEGEL